MRNNQTKAGRDTCGVTDPKFDHFTDVGRALHTWLMKKNDGYRKRSIEGTAREARKKENKVEFYSSRNPNAD